MPRITHDEATKLMEERDPYELLMPGGMERFKRVLVARLNSRAEAENVALRGEIQRLRERSNA